MAELHSDMEKDDGGSVSYAILVAAVGSAGDVPALLAEVERLRAELAHAKHRLGQVTALYEAADPSHHAPANGTLVTTTNGDRECAYLRVDTDTARADGDWWPVDSDSPVPYAVVLGHDEPPQDRPTMVIAAYVPADDLRCALDGVL